MSIRRTTWPSTRSTARRPRSPPVSSTTVTAYLDGVMQFSAPTDLMNLDGDPVNNPQQLFEIFLDNVAAGGQGEWSTGQVGLLRLWDGVLTPPQAMTLAASPYPG